MHMNTFLRKNKILLACLICIGLFSAGLKKGGKHLFILSGQSNMVGMKADISFTPIVSKAFGEENVIVVKSAASGQPIRRWYRGWKPFEGEEPTAKADLYDTLMHKIKKEIEGEDIASVTFVWMQGERDAREKHADVYEKSLLGLYSQLSTDLQRNDINFVIGRLSDFDLTNEKYKHWTRIRSIQEKVADSNPRFTWINTDDLNDGFNRSGKEISNDLHMSLEGYKIMGKRFAEKAIHLIKNND